MTNLKNARVCALPARLAQVAVRDTLTPRRAPVLCWYVDRETGRLACRWIAAAETDDQDVPIHPRFAARFTTVRRRAAC
ncbi:MULTISPECIES: hypothetical protein [unclassified Sphingomonas]|uniref:hypothetical protein n=1 Tax=unclassified Sphingomonas TaxID=196159 RepID=UPI00092C1A44|nr:MULTISPECIES: hypothetical protein [unclassified Sphingomonas]OJU21709.1 MAG: hypothetical protein BGN95_03640 [Sphingomonas sp. 66-10]